jgi:hypothetical protein
LGEHWNFTYPINLTAFLKMSSARRSASLPTRVYPIQKRALARRLLSGFPDRLPKEGARNWEKNLGELERVFATVVTLLTVSQFMPVAPD